MGGDFCYDGTMTGLLTLLAELVPRRISPDTIGVEPPEQQGLFTGVTQIPTNEQVAERFWSQLAARLPPSGLSRIKPAFLADHPERELRIYRYCLLGWTMGKRVGGMLAHPQVAPLWKLAHQVGREAHRYLGFVRFQEVSDGFYYAAISPDHRILPLIAPHFADRFGDRHWVIHDVGHGEGIVYDSTRRRRLLLPMSAHAAPHLTPSEELFRELWRNYFAALAIEERNNSKLQQGKVPLKLRPWLVEFAARPETSASS